MCYKHIINNYAQRETRKRTRFYSFIRILIILLIYYYKKYKTYKENISNNFKFSISSIMISLRIYIRLIGYIYVFFILNVVS